MRPKGKRSKRSAGTRGRRLIQSIAVGLAVAALVLLIQWGGLFTSMRVRAADYLYQTSGEPGDEIVIVAMDEQSLQALGDWPWPPDYHALLFERLGGARAVGFDVLLPDAGPEGYAGTIALVDAVRQAGNVVVPLATLQLTPPDSPGSLYAAGMSITPFNDLLDVAAAGGSVEVAPDVDGVLRQVPLLVDAGEGGVWEALSLRVLKLYLGLEQDQSILDDTRVVIGNESELKFEIRTDASGVMLVNFVGRPGSFPTYSFLDVIEDRVPLGVFEDKIVLVGMMNAANEMDLHLTPVSAVRMAGIEFHANAIHTMLHHRALVRQSDLSTAITVTVIALILSVVVSLVGALPGVFLTLLCAAGYFVFSSFQFNAGTLPSVLFPYVTIAGTYAAVTAASLSSERGERRRVADVFGRFVSPEVRDAIVGMALQDPDLVRPGGRQVVISVLFADIRGFTSISEKLEPSTVVEILNRYLDRMEEQVFEHGGTLDKYTGDGMMVLFGAPLEQPDHALRAVRAALAMQEAAIEVSRRYAQEGQTVACGIGIATGPAVVGQIGSERRLDYTAIGDTVNLAARLEGKAPPETVLISQATYDAVRDMVVAEALEPMKVKGKEKPVAVYRVSGLRQG